MQFPNNPPPPPPSAFSSNPPQMTNFQFPNQSLPKPAPQPVQEQEKPKDNYVVDSLYPAREQLRLQREKEKQQEIEERQRRELENFQKLRSQSVSEGSSNIDLLEKLRSQTSIQYPNLHLQTSLEHAQQFQNLQQQQLQQQQLQQLQHQQQLQQLQQASQNSFNAGDPSQVLLQQKLQQQQQQLQQQSQNSLNAQQLQQLQQQQLQQQQQQQQQQLQQLQQMQQQAIHNPQSSLQMQFVGQHSINPNFLQQQLLNPNSISGSDNNAELSKRLSNLGLTLQPEISLANQNNSLNPQFQSQTNIHSNNNNANNANKNITPPSFSSNMGNESILYSSFNSQSNQIPSNLFSSFSSNPNNNNNNASNSIVGLPPQSDSEKLLYRSLSSMSMDPHANQSLNNLFASSNQTNPQLNTSALYPAQNPLPNSTTIMLPPPAYSSVDSNAPYQYDRDDYESDEDDRDGRDYLVTESTTTNNVARNYQDPDELQRYSQLTYGHHKSRMKKAKKILIPIATTSGGIILGAMGGAVVGAAAGGVGAPVGAVVGAFIGGGVGLTTGVAAVSGTSSSSSVVVSGHHTYKKAKNCRGCSIPFKCLTCSYFFCPDCGFQYCEFCGVPRGIEKVCKYCAEKSNRTSTQQISYRQSPKQIEYYN